MKILNIVCHLGGGIGTTLKNFFESDAKNEHIVACLNPYDSRSETLHNIETIYDLKNDYNLLNYYVEKSEIVILHWYNHPTYYDLLLNNSLPDCRLIVWGVANNLYAPYSIPENIVNMCDRFILSSKASYQAEDYIKLSVKQKEKFGYIWCSADMLKYQSTVKQEHDTFNIGYAGTIDFNSKLHPDFVEVCSQINIPNVKFIICSSGPDLEKVKEQARQKGLQDRFIFTGRVEDLSEPLSQMNVFLYLLYEKHYGTSEQVVGEAMSCGCIPVVLDNLPEKCIVIDNVNGIVSNIKSVSKRIEELYGDKELQNKLSANAKTSAKELYDTQIMLDKWNEEFHNIMKIEKSKKHWTFSGAEIFKASLGDCRKVFDRNDRQAIKELFKSNKQWFSVTKASIFHYNDYYPNDSLLQEWKAIAEEILQEE